MDDEDFNLRLNGPGGAGDTINVPNCPFQLMTENKGTVLAGKLFFYNKDTLERYYVEAMTMDQFMMIAAAQYVTKQVVSEGRRRKIIRGFSADRWFFTAGSSLKVCCLVFR